MEVVARPSIAQLTTLRLGGFALAEMRLRDLRDFDRLPAALAATGGEPKILGGGSNLLAADGELPVTLVRPLFGEGQSPQLVGEADGKIFIRVGAGTRMPVLLAWCAEHGLSGLEGLTGVPGRLGGAVAMNAGAYGDELAPLLRELTVFTPEQGLHVLPPTGWNTSYRHFSLGSDPAWYVLAEAVLAVAPADPATVRARMRANLQRKKDTQPLDLPTAGCVFKNPPGQSAGKLLDEAGMRGQGKGGLRFTEKHANFLAHEQGGSFQAAAELIKQARHAVARHAGVNLELEIKVWPCLEF